MTWGEIMFEKTLNRIIEVVGEILLVVMTLITTFIVITRYFFKWTPSWGEESALLCMIWFGFLSMAIGVRDNLHLSLTIFDQIMSDKTKNALDWFGKILIFCFAIFMIVEGIAMSKVASGNRFTGIRLSSAWLYAAVPVSGVFIALYTVSSSIKKLKKKEEGR
jgi:TRAP-type C4-dicarboxylate transport system permease small subunit